MRIAVTRQKPDDNLDPRQYVEFKVYKSPRNGDVLGGWERLADVAEVSPGRATLHFSEKIGVPVADAWEEAIGYATDNKVGLIWLDDPNNLFQPDLED